MERSGRVSGLAWMLVLVALGLTGATPGTAAAQTAATGSVTMVSQGGDYIGGGTDFLFDSPNTISLGGGLGGVSVGTPTPAGAAFGYTIDFAPPSGQ
jgi:hypothetical protein